MGMIGRDNKRMRYDALVAARKACHACSGLTNPSVCEGGVFDCDEIGAWSRWQGNCDAKLMVVGQDWGDVAWFVREKGRDTSASTTNRTLVELLGSVGLKIKLPGESSGDGMVFFTNAVLCLKDGGAQARVSDEWFRNCGARFLRPLIDLVQPKVVVCLGERAYRAVLTAYEIRPCKFRHAVESELPVPLPSGVLAFAVYHCGARILNTHRKLAAQREDWKRIGRFLSRNTEKHDPVENTAAYKAIKRKVELRVRKAMVKDGFSRSSFGLGWCHIYWSYKKRLLKEEFHIDWKCPSEINPHIRYD